ncbi:hypothetical protein OHW66_09665 [Acinetobacter baumannii]|uniref:hypothetical protein n=1 Tax=Acinetobacter baumannii TaxID=470 RepID=UPI00233F9234|nr:hypothetical protein [Acinetobacter baumannii]
MKRNRVCLKILRYRKDHPFVFYFMMIYLGGIFIYILIYQIWFADYTKPMPLNEVGDFLAGVFAPIAFLFLYLGYKQNSEALNLQAKELKASTRALELQIKEMEASVVEQRELVNAQKRDLESRHFSVRPFLELKNERVTINIEPSDPDDIANDEKNLYGYISMDLRFTGGTARKIKIIDPDKSSNPIYEILESKADVTNKFTMYLDDESLNILVKQKMITSKIEISYFGVYGESYLDILEITLYDFSEDHLHANIYINY